MRHFDSLRRPAVNAAGVTLAQFLETVATRAYRFAETSLRHREDALDVVQDAMLKMLKYESRPADEWQALFWRILRSKIIDASRRRKFRLGWLKPESDTTESQLAWSEPSAGPAGTHDAQEAYDRMRTALHALPARQREAFTLRVLEELDVATTAQVMGVSEGSVKTHLSRAREALRRQLTDWELP